MVPLLHLLGFPESHSPPVASDIDISTNCTANIRLKHGPEIVAAGHQDVAMKEEGAAITTQCDVRKTVGTIFLPRRQLAVCRSTRPWTKTRQACEKPRHGFVCDLIEEFRNRNLPLTGHRTTGTTARFMRGVPLRCPFRYHLATLVEAPGRRGRPASVEVQPASLSCRA